MYGGHSKYRTKVCMRSVVSNLGWQLGAFAGTILVMCFVYIFGHASTDGYMNYYCNTEEATKSRGRPACCHMNSRGFYSMNTITSSLSRRMRNLNKSKQPLVYKQKEETALREPRKLAIDRDGWAGFTIELCGGSEGL